MLRRRNPKGKHGPDKVGTYVARLTVRLLQLNRVERLRERVLLLEAGGLPLG